MSLPLALAMLDAAVGIYFVAYAMRHEKRDKPAVLVVAIFIAVLRDRAEHPRPVA